MSFYSVGKNELRNLQMQEKQMQNELDVLVNKSDGKIQSLQAIRLNNEIAKIHNKIRVLSFGSPDDGDDIA